MREICRQRGERERWRDIYRKLMIDKVNRLVIVILLQTKSQKWTGLTDQKYH